VKARRTSASAAGATTRSGLDTCAPLSSSATRTGHAVVEHRSGDDCLACAIWWLLFILAGMANLRPLPDLDDVIFAIDTAKDASGRADSMWLTIVDTDRVLSSQGLVISRDGALSSAKNKELTILQAAAGHKWPRLLRLKCWYRDDAGTRKHTHHCVVLHVNGLYNGSLQVAVPDSAMVDLSSARNFMNKYVDADAEMCELNDIYYLERL
jgi:hypothetical protein